VVYPRDSSLITARDSNFIFGSVGNGNARLTIDGQPVPVEPNGAFLAWLPVPPPAEDTLVRYELVASLAGEEIRATHVVRLPPPLVLLPADSAAIDTLAVSPRGAWWVREGEPVPIRVRASPGAQVRLVLPAGDTIGLREVPSLGSVSAANWIFGRVPRAAEAAVRQTGIYEAELIAQAALGQGWLDPRSSPVPVDSLDVPPYCAPPPPPDTISVEADTGAAVVDTSAVMPDTAEAVTDTIGAEADTAVTTVAAEQVPDTAVAGPSDTVGVSSELWLPPECALLEVLVGEDTARARLPLDLWVLENPGPVVALREPPTSTSRDGLVVGRAGPGSTTLWLWAEGVRARVSGRRNGVVRLAPAERAEAWVSLEEVVASPGVTLPARARVSTVRVAGRPDRLEVRISLSAPVPYTVEVDGRRFSLLLYGAYSDTNWLRYGPEDPFLRAVRWEQVESDRYVLHLELAAPVWGYRVRIERGALILEVRKPPPVDPKRPLRGRTIVVDPGHPPAGATGPTRLYEADANLALAFRLKRLLEQEGAKVYLTRADRRPVGLYERTVRAELLDAEILLSIHNNALPDGVNPFENHGTSVYYFHPHSLELARSLQRGLLAALGLRDLGIGRASLALARPIWMPAALTEGAFMMVPDQEAGLRNPVFLEAHARGLLDGLREFLKQRAQ
jgi:N-acetylmuramoyl-L-alanine amidase